MIGGLQTMVLVELYFQVDDVNDAVSRLRAQGYLTQSLADSWIAGSGPRPIASESRS